jgi:hypothetical protein
MDVGFSSGSGQHLCAELILAFFPVVIKNPYVPDE